MTSVQEFYDKQWDGNHDYVFSEAMKNAMDHSYYFLGALSGKTIIEVGGGDGKQAIYFATQGAAVTIVDISTESLKRTQHLAQQQGVKLVTILMNAEQLEFPAESFDFVYINSLFMHVNQQKVLQECSRILKKGGKLVIVEPLQYAPFMQVYRLFSSYRKMKPRYATLKMFRTGKKYFTEYQHQEFYFLSSALLPLFYVKNKYLHKIYHYVSTLDNVLLKILPFLRYGCWVSVVEYRK
ncbi:MAG: class I SAM-dependent methyltransferase [Nanoarchaeota archaeon]|nr:class I SAM-dependent methyltransferase [Nanoarchaeota archaeon]